MFKTGMSQEDILCNKLKDDYGEMMDYWESVAQSSSTSFRILDKNPLHLGFFLYAVRQKGDSYYI